MLFLSVYLYTAINCCSWKLETMDRRFLTRREGIRKEVVEKYKKISDTIKTENIDQVFYLFNENCKNNCCFPVFRQLCRKISFQARLINSS